MVDFAKLKNSRTASFEALNSKLSKLNDNSKSTKDERFWSPTVDDQGNGYAVIRFLPAPGDESDPFVRIFNHGFQGPGGWYIENSLTTIGEDDPVAKYNKKLWDSGIDANKEIARKQKRRLKFISNIYVVKDSGNPANEGKVFLYEYGKKIFEKINDVMQPKFEDEEPINPFDLWEGANFKLKIRNGEGGYRTYDKSEFADKAALANDDAELERIWKSEYSLADFLDRSKFKTYEELEKRLNKVLGVENETPRIPFAAPKSQEREMLAEAPSKSQSWDGDSSDGEDEDVDDFLKKLLEDDE